LLRTHDETKIVLQRQYRRGQRRCGMVRFEIDYPLKGFPGVL
jgi:hypothetical protein